MENKNYIVAIDLGSGNVAVAAGTMGADGKVRVEDVEVRESKGVSRGEVKNVEQAAQSVKEAVAAIEERLGITVSEAVTGISGSHVKCAKHPYYVHVAGKDGEISEEDVKKLNDSMRNVKAPDGYTLLHIIPQLYVVDDDEEVLDPVGMFGKTLGSTFNLIVGENNITSRLTKALQKVDIRQAKLFINSLATAEAVTFPDEKDLGVAVVDIGTGTTDVCIYHDGIVRYLGVIPMGAEAINKDIRSYGIMERYVEELKVKYGCALASMVDSEKLIKVPGRTPSDHKEISFKNLAAIIEARLFDIVDYVKDEIKDSGYEDKLSAGIVLTGGCSLLNAIKPMVEQRTGLEVRIACPDILVDDESKEKIADPRLSTVIGILAQALNGGVSTATAAGARKQRLAAKPKETVPADTIPERTPEKKKYTEPLDIEDPEVDDDGFFDSDFSKPKKKRKGLFGTLKDKLEKTFDFDVLDDDNTI